MIFIQKIYIFSFHCEYQGMQDSHVIILSHATTTTNTRTYFIDQVYGASKQKYCESILLQVNFHE